MPESLGPSGPLRGWPGGLAVGRSIGDRCAHPLPSSFWVLPPPSMRALDTDAPPPPLASARLRSPPLASARLRSIRLANSDCGDWVCAEPSVTTVALPRAGGGRLVRRSLSHSNQHTPLHALEIASIGSIPHTTRRGIHIARFGPTRLAESAIYARLPTLLGLSDHQIRPKRQTACMLTLTRRRWRRVFGTVLASHASHSGVVCPLACCRCSPPTAFGTL